MKKNQIITSKDAIIAALTEQVAALKKQIEELEELLNRNSKNSSSPLSQDKPKNQALKPNKKSRLWHKGCLKKNS